MIKIDHVDHLVLTVSDIETTCVFCTNILGMEVVTFGGTHKGLMCDQQKSNLHELGANSSLKLNNLFPALPTCVS